MSRATLPDSSLMITGILLLLAGVVVATATNVNVVGAPPLTPTLPPRQLEAPAPTPTSRVPLPELRDPLPIPPQAKAAFPTPPLPPPQPGALLPTPNMVPPQLGIPFPTPPLKWVPPPISRVPPPQLVIPLPTPPIPSRRPRTPPPTPSLPPRQLRAPPPIPHLSPPRLGIPLPTPPLLGAPSPIPRVSPPALGVPLPSPPLPPRRPGAPPPTTSLPPPKSGTPRPIPPRLGGPLPPLRPPRLSRAPVPTPPRFGAPLPLRRSGAPSPTPPCLGTPLPTPLPPRKPGAPTRTPPRLGAPLPTPLPPRRVGAPVPTPPRRARPPVPTPPRLGAPLPTPISTPPMTGVSPTISPPPPQLGTPPPASPPVVTPKGPRVPALLVFGDSIVDTGNNNHLITAARANFPPYGKDFPGHKATGRFSDGKVSVDFLASALGLKELLPPYLKRNLTLEELKTGVTFASGASGYDNATCRTGSAMTVERQLQLFMEYKKKVGTVPERALFLVVLGSNDIVQHFTFADGLTEPEYSDFLAQRAVAFAESLIAQGARQIAVTGVPPIGCVPSQRRIAGGVRSQCATDRNQLALMFNRKLSVGLGRLASKNRSVNIFYVDLYSIVSDIVQRYRTLGFVNSKDSCCGVIGLAVGPLCNMASVLCQDPGKYVFWDSYHPTERANKIMIDDFMARYSRYIK